MALREFFGEEIKLSDPASSVVPILPDDEEAISSEIKSLFVVESGDLVFIGHRDDDIERTWPVTAGQFLYIRPKYIMAATTAVVDGLRD